MNSGAPRAALGHIEINLNTGLPSKHLVYTEDAATYIQRGLIDAATLSANSEEASFEMFAELGVVCARCLEEWLNSE